MTSTKKTKQYFTKKFCNDYKMAGIDKRIVAKKARALSRNPNLGHSFDPLNPECKQWAVTMNRNVYYWHYIDAKDHGLIQSVALKKQDIDKLNGSPLSKLLFGMRLLGAMTREFLTGLLTGA